MDITARVDLSRVAFRCESTFAPGATVRRVMELTPFGVRLIPAGGEDGFDLSWAQLTAVNLQGADLAFVGSGGLWMGGFRVVERHNDVRRLYDLVSGHHAAFGEAFHKGPKMDARLRFLRSEGVHRDGG